MRSTMMALGLSAAVAPAPVVCESPPPMGRYTYEVPVNPSITDGVVVSFVGPPKDEATTWAGRDANTFYNTPALREREDVYDSMVFGGGRPRTQTLPVGDPIWNRWSEGGAEQVFIYVASVGLDADARTKHETSLEITDTRPKNSTVRFVVDKAGIREVAAPEAQ